MRREHDFYPTPGWATRMLLERVPIDGKILEPCSGRGDIADVLRDYRNDLRFRAVVTNDYDKHQPSVLHDDATDQDWWSIWAQTLSWVVTNPPFGVAHRILPLAYKATLGRVAMLLRLSYLEPCEGRASWLVAHPPTRLYVLPRISFTGDGKTDSVTCAWYVWNRNDLGQRIEVIPPTENGQLSLLEATA